MISERGSIIPAQNITGLSAAEATFLSQLAEREQSIFRFAEALAFWQHESAARSALSHMQQGGWVKRIERGLYMLVPLSAGPQRMWTENALVVASHLLQPSAIAYWSALHYWNLTEQLPRTVFVQSPRRKSKRDMTVMGVHYRFITIQPQRFFGLVAQTVDQHAIQVTDREKTLVDTADRPDLSGGIGQLVETLRGHWEELDWQRVDAYLVQFASGAVVKRLGYLLEALALPIPHGRELLQRWRSQLSTGIALLEPGGSPDGRVLRRWRVQDNAGVAQHQQGEGS
jgi:predicted transcriptional regulator of viral defense system